VDSRRLRLFLVAAVATLMGLNAVGAYGFLGEGAHRRPRLPARRRSPFALPTSMAVLPNRTQPWQNIDRQLSQIDGAINKAVEEGSHQRRDGAC